MEYITLGNGEQRHYRVGLGFIWIRLTANIRKITSLVVSKYRRIVFLTTPTLDGLEWLRRLGKETASTLGARPAPRARKPSHKGLGKMYFPGCKSGNGNCLTAGSGKKEP